MSHHPIKEKECYPSSCFIEYIGGTHEKEIFADNDDANFGFIYFSKYLLFVT